MILDPEKEEGTPHRPSIITFEDKSLVPILGPTIRSFGKVLFNK